MHCICYAKDKRGTMLGNYEVGLNKRFMITWDEHHQKKWRRFWTDKGTWIRGDAIKGRKFQRERLLETWLDPNFVDPFPNGTKNKALGAPTNVIHTVSDFSGAGLVLSNSSAQKAAVPCYPGTKIPLSCSDIKSKAYKFHHPSAIKVIADFISGSMAGGKDLKGFRESQADKVESAFFELGWRADRYAILGANKAMRDGNVGNALESQAWINAPPLQVDRFKGDEVKNLLEGMVFSDEENEENGDEVDEESDNQDDGLMFPDSFPGSVGVAAASNRKRAMEGVSI